MYKCEIWYLEDPAGESAEVQLLDQVINNVLKALKDQHPDKNDIKKAVLDAYWDVAWRLRLFEEVNEGVEGKLQDTLPRYVWLVGWLQHNLHATFGEELLLRLGTIPKLVSRQISAKVAPLTVTKKVTLDSRRQDAEWEQGVRTLIKTLYALRIAHEQIAAECFEGHPILWKDTREALDRRTGEAEELLKVYTSAVALHRECIKKDVPFNPEIWTKDNKWLAHASGVLKKSLDKIKQEAASLAFEYATRWNEIAHALVSASHGDRSGAIRLMKQCLESAKTQDPKTGNPDPGGCARGTQNQA
jgi:hypothetical protein